LYCSGKDSSTVRNERVFFSGEAACEAIVVFAKDWILLTPPKLLFTETELD
jgi:hypothetical protein